MIDDTAGGIGPYILVEKIGEGAMGDVFRAKHRSLGREVALKVLRRDVGRDPESLEQFRREMKISVDLVHHGLVRVLDCELEGATPYLAAELVAGQTLRKRLDERGKLPWREALGRLHDLAAALVYLHARGVLHRDIKPSNILIGDEGRFKLADFGIARRVDAGTLSRAGDFLGTWLYAAPERLMGDRHTERADLWSLGLVLFETLTGRLPLPDTEYMDWCLQGGRPLDPPGHFEPAVPAPVSRLVMSLLERHPADRLASAAMLEARIGALLGLEPGAWSVTTGSPDEMSRVTDVTEVLDARASPRRGLTHVVIFVICCLALASFSIRTPPPPPEPGPATPATIPSPEPTPHTGPLFEEWRRCREDLPRFHGPRPVADRAIRRAKRRTHIDLGKDPAAWAYWVELGRWLGTMNPSTPPPRPGDKVHEVAFLFEDPYRMRRLEEESAGVKAGTRPPPGLLVLVLQMQLGLPDDSRSWLILLYLLDIEGLANESVNATRIAMQDIRPLSPGTPTLAWAGLMLALSGSGQADWVERFRELAVSASRAELERALGHASGRLRSGAVEALRTLVVAAGRR